MAQRLIDAARFERRLMFTVDRDEICDDCLRNFLNEMAKEPTIDPAKHGRWIGKPLCGSANCLCSECEKIFNVRANSRGEIIQKYCPNCGAKMDADE